MTTDRTEGTHPADSELAAWADEPDVRSAVVEGHVADCHRCRERLAELGETRAALALDPPMPSAAAFAAQREQILEAIGASPRAEGGRIVGRLAWLIPLAAAATIAAIVLVGRDEGTNEPRTADTGAETTRIADAVPDFGVSPLPVVTAAREAAEDAAAAFDEAALDALAAAEPLAPPLSVERSEAIEMEFAQLPEEAQSAVLLELASADFDL